MVTLLRNRFNNKFRKIDKRSTWKSHICIQVLTNNTGPRLALFANHWARLLVKGVLKINLIELPDDTHVSSKKVQFMDSMLFLDRRLCMKLLALIFR